MKKSITTKIFVTTILMATFFVVNCQKAPGRKVQATGKPNAKPTSVQYADCNASAMDALKDRKKNQSEILVIIKEPDKVDAAQKQKLMDLVESLKKSSKTAVEEIQKLKLQGSSAPATGCKGPDVEATAEIIKVKNYVIADIKKEDEKLISDANKITGRTDIRPTPQISGPQANNQTMQAEVNDSVLVQGQTISVSKQLGEALEKSTHGEESIVFQSGVMFSNRDKAEDVTRIQADKKSTFCTISGFGAKLEENAQLFVAAALSEAGSVTLVLTQQDKMYGLKCQIAEGKAELKDNEIRSAMGALLKVVKNPIQ